MYLIFIASTDNSDTFDGCDPICRDSPCTPFLLNVSTTCKII